MDQGKIIARGRYVTMIQNDQAMCTDRCASVRQSTVKAYRQYLGEFALSPMQEPIPSCWTIQHDVVRMQRTGMFEYNKGIPVAIQSDRNC